MIFILLISIVTSVGALNCTDGLQYGHSTTTSTIGANLTQFVSIVGSFYNDTWYNYPVNSTIGPNNQVNSTRIITDSTGTLVFYETLIVYQLNNSFFEQSWQGPGDNIKSVNYGSFVLGIYTETLIGQSICRDSSVFVNFSIEFCATNLTTATTVLTDGHIVGIQQVRNALVNGSSPSCSSISNSIKSNPLFTRIIIALFGVYWIILT